MTSLFQRCEIGINGVNPLRGLSFAEFPYHPFHWIAFLSATVATLTSRNDIIWRKIAALRLRDKMIFVQDARVIPQPWRVFAISADAVPINKATPPIRIGESTNKTYAPCTRTTLFLPFFFRMVFAVSCFDNPPSIPIVYAPLICLLTDFLFVVFIIGASAYRSASFTPTFEFVTRFIVMTKTIVFLERMTMRAKLKRIWLINHSVIPSLYSMWMSANGGINRCLGATLADNRIIPHKVIYA